MNNFTIDSLKLWKELGADRPNIRTMLDKEEWIEIIELAIEALEQRIIKENEDHYPYC